MMKRKIKQCKQKIEVDESVDSSEVDQTKIGTTTRSGRVTVRLSKLIHEMSAVGISHAERNYYSILAEG